MNIDKFKLLYIADRDEFLDISNGIEKEILLICEPEHTPYEGQKIQVRNLMLSGFHRPDLLCVISQVIEVKDTVFGEHTYRLNIKKESFIDNHGLMDYHMRPSMRSAGNYKPTIWQRIKSIFKSW